MKQSFTIRLEPEQIEQIKAIAPEGNVSMWLRQLINEKLNEDTDEHIKFNKNIHYK